MKKMLKSLLVLSALFFSAPYAATADSYPEKAGGKLGTGIANAVGGIWEIPKTMIITTRTEGPVYGLTVGLMAGMLHTLGRTVYGVVDMATFLIPTKPLVDPDYIWNDSDRITSYKAKVEMR
jgi:putative exosortase-associated protein (TIGR04073 family)